MASGAVLFTESKNVSGTIGVAVVSAAGVDEDVGGSIMVREVVIVVTDPYGQFVTVGAQDRIVETMVS